MKPRHASSTTGSKSLQNFAHLHGLEGSLGDFWGIIDTILGVLVVQFRELRGLGIPEYRRLRKSQQLRRLRALRLRSTAQRAQVFGRHTKLLPKNSGNKNLCLGCFPLISKSPQLGFESGVL